MRKLLTIKGHPDYAVNMDGIVFSNKRGKYRKLRTSDNRGYQRVFTYENSVRSMLSVHRVVAQTFIPNPEGKPQVNHKNGIRNDNRVENLEWATASENVRHSMDVLGRQMKRSGDHHRASPIIQRTLDGEFVERYGAITEAIECTEHKLNHGLISACCLGNRKTHAGFLWSYA